MDIQHLDVDAGCQTRRLPAAPEWASRVSMSVIRFSSLVGVVDHDGALIHCIGDGSSVLSVPVTMGLSVPIETLPALVASGSTA